MMGDQGDEWVVVYEGTHANAGMLNGLLEGAGVPVLLHDEITSTVMLHGSIKLSVRRSDLEAAMPIVQQFVAETSGKADD